MSTLATLEELQARLDWVLDEGEQGVAVGALEDLSDEAAFYGVASWTDPATVPHQVKNLVLRAAARFMRNPDGYTTSRAGDETLGWTDLGEDAGTAFFNERERRMLEQLAGKGGGLVSVPLVAWGPTRHTPRYVNPHEKDLRGGTVYAPTDSGKPFPIATEDEIF